MKNKFSNFLSKNLSNNFLINYSGPIVTTQQITSSFCFNENKLNFYCKNEFLAFSLSLTEIIHINLEEDENLLMLKLSDESEITIEF